MEGHLSLGGHGLELGEEAMGEGGARTLVNVCEVLCGTCVALGWCHGEGCVEHLHHLQWDEMR
jgi:hypothetical protein